MIQDPSSGAPTFRPEPYVTDAMVHAALATKNPALYREHLRHPANGPLTRASTEAEIDLTRAMIAAAMQAAPRAEGGQDVDENGICYIRSDLAGDPSRPGRGDTAPASEREPVDAAVRKACGNIIKALASIVTAPQTDAQFDADVLPRDPIMARVTQIRAQVDVIYRAVPAPVHPTMQYAASREKGGA